MIAWPHPDEYSPFFQGYLDDLAAAVPELRDGAADILAVLERQGAETRDLLSGIPESQGGFRYAPGKWTIKEVVGHLADAEQVLAWRALAVSRGERQELPGFEEDDWVAAANFTEWKLADLAANLADIRRVTVALFRGLNGTMWTRAGTANGSRITAGALAFIIAGHERHHVNILRERYLSQV